MSDFKLKYKNVWGNYEQFTDELGTQEYKNNIVVNHYIGMSLVASEIDDILNFAKQMEWYQWKPNNI